MSETDQQPEQRHQLREHFLEMFVRSMIIDAYDAEKDKALKEGFMKDKLEDMTDELKRTQIPPAMSQEQEYLGGKPLPKMPAPQKSQFAPILPSSMLEMQHFQKKFGIVEPKMHPSPSRMPFPKLAPIPLPQQVYQPTKLKPGQKVETVNLGKLANILVDPSVVSLECPGPYKNLLINRGGSIQTSGLTLNSEEINTIMHNVSDQTRIPITPGVFRAAIQDLVVTAVLSDFVGTRFVIQKRNPFQRY